jgi:MYXO-CTERM domain-containing protein
LDGAVISDAFPDPIDAARVLAIAAPRGAGGGAYRLLESSDGGVTFPIVRYTAAAGDTLSGVEIARADPATVHLIILKGADLAPTLALSTDRGATWQEHDLSATLGMGSVLLIAVDRDDPRRAFLQVNGPSANVLAVVEGGGTTVSTPLRLESGFMSGFLQTSGGAILVSGLIGAEAVLHRSRDGGRSFVSVPAPPTLWGFSERNGTIFGAARIGSPFAITTSTDEGTTWQPFMRYEDVGAIAGCVQDVCEDSCLTQAAVKLWPAQMCMPHASPPGDAAGMPEDATGAAPEATGEGPPDGAAVDDGPTTGPMTAGARPPGCACSTSTAGARGWWASAVLAGAWRRRRARRPPASTGS